MFKRFEVPNYIRYPIIGLLMLGGLCALPACTASTEDAPPVEPIASTQQALVEGWTNWTSEEGQPVNCDGSSLVSKFECSGSKCDNMRLFCQPTSAVRADSYWTPYFSEEKPRNGAVCAEGYWVTGLQCKGNYCDNVSFQCSRMTNVGAFGCDMTTWHSEENGGNMDFPSGYYAIGAECSGSNCDNLRYLICHF